MSFRCYNDDDVLQLCRFSYETRGSSCMKELAKRCPKSPISIGSEDSNASNFSQVLHYIGRIGSHMKAAKILVAAALRFPTFFDCPQVKCLPSPEPAKKPPPMDELTTLDGIVIRMLPKDDPKIPSYQEALQFMDTKFGIYRRVAEKYKDDNFLPRVHAELILLEHFHANTYRFVGGDKYIGCSKPACYCCFYYISAHPGNFVQPASHNKTYLNWRPPDVADNDPKGSVRQRDVLNTMIKRIRGEVLEQIMDRRGPRAAHHDSTTGITLSGWR